MYFLGSRRNCKLFIITLLISIIVSNSLGEILPGYTHCFTIDNSWIYNTSVVDFETGERLTNITDEMPKASTDMKFTVNGSHPTIAWLINPRGTTTFDRLKHILLQIVQDYTRDNGTFSLTEYRLLNVSGKDLEASIRIFRYNCTKIRPGAYQMKVTAWFLEDLGHNSDGHLIAQVSKDIRRRTGTLTKDDLDPDELAAKRAAEDCICKSDVFIRVGQTGTGDISTMIQGSKVPTDTKIEIQLIREEKSGKYIEESSNVSGEEIQRPFWKSFKVPRGRHYFIRVLRHCQKGFDVPCRKKEADVMRSVTIYSGKERKRRKRRDPC